MGQAAVGSNGICDGQNDGETRGNEDILYNCRHFCEMKGRTIDRATCGPGKKEPWDGVQIRTILVYTLLRLHDRSASKQGIILNVK